MKPNKNVSTPIKSNKIDFTITLSTLFLATLIALILVEASQINDNIFGVYILAVVIVSRFTSGFFWGILSSVVGVIGVNYFFTFPYFKIDFTLSGYSIIFLIMFFISIIISIMTVQIKEQAFISEQKEKKANTLYEINKKLLATRGLNNIINLTLDYLYSFYESTVIFYLEDPHLGGEGIIKSISEEHNQLLHTENEFFTVHLVFRNKKMAGAGTSISTKSRGIYVPIVSHGEILGVVGLICDNIDFWDKENVTFLDVLVSQVALAIERQKLSDKQRHILVETEKEKMRSNLLRAISHDLRTPLTCILGSSATLLENKSELEPTIHDKLIFDIHEDAKWLINMVENLLTVTRISEETATVKKSPEAVEEVISEAVMRVKKRYPNCGLNVKIPEELLMVPMDAILIEQVIINLIENSIKHSGNSNAPIQIIVTFDTTQAIFKISDDGIGLKKEDLPKIFDGYSLNQNKSSDSSRGMGIGLSICKSIINAHSGAISAYNKKSGGAVFQFTLPLKGETQNDK